MFEQFGFKETVSDVDCNQNGPYKICFNVFMELIILTLKQGEMSDEYVVH